MSTKVSGFPTATTPYVGTETVLGVQPGQPNNVQITLPGLRQYLAEFLVPDVFSASSGQTAFTLSRTPFYPTGAAVIQNGVELAYTADYTISGTTLTLVTGATAGDTIKARYL